MTLDLSYLLGAELAPTAPYVAENGTVAFRGNRYGELYSNQYSLDRLAHEGALFKSVNATQGTGIAQTANTTSDTTKPFIVMTVPSTALKSVHLHRLVLKPTAVSSGQTIQTIDVVTCDGSAYSSAGTDYLAQASNIAAAGYMNVGRTGRNNASVMSVFRVGAPVTVLGATPKNVVRFVPRQTTIPVVADRYIMNFGSLFSMGSAQTNVVEPVSTTVNQYIKNDVPVIIDPGTSCLIIPWAASVSGAMSWEFELIWSEK